MIVLTAKGEVEDRIAGLDAGAIDYVVKPFSVAELAARIRAQLRRRAASRARRSRAASYRRRPDLARGDAWTASAVRLSTTEFELLVYLLRNRGHVLTREQILRAVWGYGHDPGTNVVDVYVGYLRRKLTTPERTAPITTVRSVGYRFDGSGP